MQKDSGVGSGGDWNQTRGGGIRRCERRESQRGSVRHAFTLLVARELVNVHSIFIILIALSVFPRRLDLPGTPTYFILIIHCSLRA